MPAILNPSLFILHHRHPPAYSTSSSSSLSVVSSVNQNVRTGRSGSATSPPVEHDDAQKIDVDPPKGTRDFPPEDMRLRNWLFHNFREVSQQFGFEEVDFPVLESEALYIRKAGEEIRDQLYCFEDRGNRRVALRPELTPSLARLVIQKSVSLPLKWFAIGQCWRYERMTRGRRREHYQWNMDIIGIPDVTVLQEVLRCYSVPENMFGRVCIIIDKIGKIPMNDIRKDLQSTDMSEVAIEELSQGFDREGKLRAICGGGRYDRLLSTFGGDDLPACGFGFGDAVIVELLKERGLLPELNLQVENIVCSLDQELQSAASAVATILREKGQSVDLVLENKPLKWVFKRAAQINARRLILVGKAEWQKGMVNVKTLSTGEQLEIKLDELE
ncbi:unnamed protein product [Withania somnifera]